ncbi:MAG TPA: gluconeogenesis factor YvcK family protein [Candidatus Dormibacteraeota bacterium]|nr:gluconeogenesis factor YvcK family protein [Candidatus Dormibacteraeota bacterium]
MIQNSPNIVVIGGGTGSFTILKDLKKFTPNITAIVNMSDDGGSSGVLRDELGVLPPGDIRQCLVALSDNPEARNLFNYRFGDGRFDGQSLGNIILSGLELQHHSLGKAIQVSSDILQSTGRVIPITMTKHILVMKDGSTIIKGEHNISKRIIKNNKPLLYLEPMVKINKDAAKAILDADLVVIAPGNLYSSLLPIFSVKGVDEAIAASRAKVIEIVNLINKPGQTDGWHVADYVKELERYIGKNQIDVVLYNTEPISDQLIAKYAADKEFPVSIKQSRLKEIKAKLVGTRLVSKEISAQDPNDKKIRRTLIRHDGIEISRQLMRIYYE